jgi:uracil-DNA glycosylase family 4
VFVGEGPGFNEDQQGRPFVGAAGSFLTELLASIGWRREEVFITNVVKCRPPGNRDPEPEEIAACAPFLERQLEVLDPALVVTLGRFSLGAFMPGARIGAVHGTVRHADTRTGAADAMAFAMYHPAAAFRQQSLRDTIAADMCEVPGALLASRRAREARRRGSVDDDPIPQAPANGRSAPPDPVAAQVTDAGFATRPDPATDPVAAAPAPPETVFPSQPASNDQLSFFR